MARPRLHRRHPRMLAVVLAVGLVAATPAATQAAEAPSCPDADLVPLADNLDRVAEAVVCLINTERSDAGLVPLTHDPLLNRSSQQKTDDMVASHYYAHEAPPGRPSLLQRIMATGYFFATAGGL